MKSLVFANCSNGFSYGMGVRGGGVVDHSGQNEVVCYYTSQIFRCDQKEWSLH
jgi:hypothetical protein